MAQAVTAAQHSLVAEGTVLDNETGTGLLSIAHDMLCRSEAASRPGAGHPRLHNGIITLSGFYYTREKRSKVRERLGRLDQGRGRPISATIEPTRWRLERKGAAPIVGVRSCCDQLHALFALP
jgi:hypothetical protein